MTVHKKIFCVFAFDLAVLLRVRMRGTPMRTLPQAWRWGLPLALLCAAALLLLNLLSGSLLLSPARRFAHDPDYSALALGQQPLPMHGLNLLAWSGALAAPEEVAELRAAYSAWREFAQRELEAQLGVRDEHPSINALALGQGGLILAAGTGGTVRLWDGRSRDRPAGELAPTGGSTLPNI